MDVGVFVKNIFTETVNINNFYIIGSNYNLEDMFVLHSALCISKQNVIYSILSLIIANYRFEGDRIFI